MCRSPPVLTAAVAAHRAGFSYSGFMTALTTATYMTCAAAERASTRDILRKGSLRDYALLSVVTFLGMYFTNWCGLVAVRSLLRRR